MLSNNTTNQKTATSKSMSFFFINQSNQFWHAEILGHWLGLHCRAPWRTNLTREIVTVDLQKLVRLWTWFYSSLGFFWYTVPWEERIYISKGISKGLSGVQSARTVVVANVMASKSNFLLKIFNLFLLHIIFSFLFFNIKVSMHMSF